MSEETTQSDTSIAMPGRPGWYLVEVAGLARQPESGFMLDYCREASPTDGGGMQWIDNYRNNVIAWYPLPKRNSNQ